MRTIMVVGVAVALAIATHTQDLQEVQKYDDRVAMVEEREMPKMGSEPEVIEKVVQKEPEPEQITVVATAYVSDCQGCIGITKGGTDVRNTIYHDSGHRIIATDPSVIPLESLVEIDGQRFIADDTGGAIKGHRIDILMESESEALEFGVREVDVIILRRGE